MQTKGYRLIKPDFLICDAFPTTFTVSGGPNFADDYLHKAESDSDNSVTIQHCIRHWDYDKVGDGLHLSFFEMGVTTAYNGYTQRQLFEHHLEFLCDVLGLPIERFFVTVFGGGKVRGREFPEDSETIATWRSLGLKDENVFIIPGEVPPEISQRVRAEKGEDGVARESFVANAVEPVGGPRTEIFFDTGRPGRCEPLCVPGFCNCGKFVEFWTSVHYVVHVTPSLSHSDRAGEMVLEFEPIKDAIYAAGFGLERTSQILLGKPSICEVQPLPDIASVFSAAGNAPIHPATRKHICAVVDHIRGLTFLLAEGVHQLSGKANRSRKYEYRRYVRSLFWHLQYLEAQGLHVSTGLIRRLVEKTLEVHLHEFPYKELYYKDRIDTAKIVAELADRLERLRNELPCQGETGPYEEVR
jgi:alanyl-tRNA synthetase